ncbi:hypothetical protein [Glaciimonas sp. PAMC28666]|uniref:hypothetical protein n=1 Tax=Glaciimonas sp. PAMC28666 TaxID=2807626 RepID=UPI0019642653|nr:hypothetical protein [Glaciimonas sp. PAMC28666]QRX82341.1 hypothetical protein JQN73_19990 [Glaciimonas sp. PAMC28666]
MRHLTLLSMVLLAGCATTGSDNGRIQIETGSMGEPLTAARCIVKTDGGTWNLTTPAEVVITVADGDLHVACSKNGYRNGEIVYKASPGAGLPSMGISGVGGGGIGLGQGTSFPVSVDSNVAYPSRILVEMDRL